ncbi:sodium/hydrogen exchanger [Luteimicrobium album]|uniref:Sodium/hydrogen exchanger n=1 Tax=Luteimicrobium album TaxID=1054550 RepID=A0ABQ6I2M0_9MICO|nr:cation:proton antiporter [Luteimicrobium album]GMA24408.1 sodium/hydrogen exchanger [Luteimicrobium album]
MDHEAWTLVLFALCAALAPLLARGVRRFAPVPVVVFEILLGLLVGPALLGWATPGDLTDRLSDFGLAMLFFLAGHEIDVAGIRGRPLRRAVGGWIVSLVVGVGLGVLLGSTAAAGVFVGIALTSTALGTILPVISDAGELGTPFGRAVSAVGAVGEFGPLIAISIFLSGRQPGKATVVLLIFVVLAAGAVWLAVRAPHARVHRAIEATLHTSGQFAVRLVMLVVAALVALSVWLGLDMLLGAFVAGLVLKALMRDAADPLVEQVDAKIEAVGYGFLVPVFFVSTGVTFDLDALLGSTTALLELPLFLVLFLVVRGVPGSFAAPDGATRRDRTSLAFFSATALPIIVAVTNIGRESGDLSSATATSLVGAGLLSVLVFPLVGLALRGSRRDVEARADETTEVPEEA